MNNIYHTNLGGSEDWSARYTNRRTGKSLCIIDTGGNYEVVKNLELYIASGRGVHRSFSQHGEALAFVYSELKG